MLLECINYLKLKKKNFKTLKLYGQEKNLTTSSIAKINMFLHEVEDFNILRGDTLNKPEFFDGDTLKRFDCVIANPPFSLKNWGPENWTNDPHGRNVIGKLSKSNGDIAWVLHMIKSMKSDGRMAVVLPKGILFRSGNDKKFRKYLLENDILDGIIGLGPNIFYGTQLEACILILNKNKHRTNKDKIFIINASKEYHRWNIQNFIEEEHLKKIFNNFLEKKEIISFSKQVNKKEIISNDYSLNVPLYVDMPIKKVIPLDVAMADIEKSYLRIKELKDNFIEQLEKIKNESN